MLSYDHAQKHNTWPHMYPYQHMTWLKATLMWIHMPMIWDGTWKWHACDHIHSQKWYMCTYKCIQWHNWTWKWLTCKHKCSSWHMMVLEHSAYEYTHIDCNGTQKCFMYECTCPCPHVIYCTQKCLCMSSYALIDVIVLRNSIFEHSCSWWHVIVLKLSCVC